MILLTGCSGNKSGQPVSFDSVSDKDTNQQTTEIQPEIYFIQPDSGKYKNPFPEKDFASLIEKKLSKWLNYQKQNHPSLDIRKFNRSNELGFSSMQHWPLKREFNHDDSLSEHLRSYSPNRKFAVDIYSGAYIFWENNGKTFLSGGDPESAIYLTDFNDSTVHQIQYTGSAEGFQDIIWIDPERFLVTGSIYLQPDSIQLNYQVFDLRSRTKLYFTSENMPVTKEKSKNYICIKFPEYCYEEE